MNNPYIPKDARRVDELYLKLQRKCAERVQQLDKLNQVKPQVNPEISR